MLRSRKLLLLLVLVFSALFLAGCSPTGEPMVINKDEVGIWGNFVFSMLEMLRWFADNWFAGHYGLSILIVTIIVRLIILPLSIKQYRSMKKMQEIQPQMKEIREKHKDDPKKQQEEMIKLFQETGVNPMGGCLPMLIQMPFIFALYMAISPISGYQQALSIDIANEHFLWFKLGEIDSFWLPLLAAITTFLQQAIMMAANTTPQAKTQMQIMAVIFPVMIFFTAMYFPAALPLYWVYSNIFTIFQTYFMYFGLSHWKKQEVPAVEIIEPKKSSKKAGMSKR